MRFSIGFTARGLAPRALFTAAFLATTAAPGVANACSSCGCSLSTEWTGDATTTAAGSGLRIDARFDFVDQNQLRLGSHAVSKTPDPAALPADNEFQQGTLTRFYNLGADYSFNKDWGVNVQLPYLVREHQTIAPGQDTPDISTSETQGVGDVRIVGRYQGFFEDRSWGVQAGIKLPTGSYHHTFATGPAAGEIIDRGLQNGSGTTDLILGVYHYKALSREWDHFEQLQVKQALDRRSNFRPSTQWTSNVGVRYVGFGRVVPQLQLNARVEGREVGAEADYENSGSQAVYLTPGLAGTVYGKLAAYSFVQVPVYQHYTGYQLAPHYLATFGLSYGF